MPKVHWSALTVRRDGVILEERERLAELYCFLQGKHVLSTHVSHEMRVNDPMDIDWTEFPVSEAMEAAAIREDRAATVRRP